ncbi:hypothetical protein [Sorangium cellulosum]|nr:hypothetical protein [Sorangium cellulosum]
MGTSAARLPSKPQGDLAEVDSVNHHGTPFPATYPITTYMAR